MSNVNAPFGFRPIRMLNGCQSFALGDYTIASAYNTALYRGDPVKLTGTGKNIAQAAAGDLAVGVFAGFKFIDAYGQIQFAAYWPANYATFNSESAQAMVWDSPDIVFAIQCDNLAEGAVGTLCDWAIGTGNAILQRSGAYATAATNATSGKMLRLLGLTKEIDSEYGAYARAEVMFAAHSLSGVAAGAGGV